MLNEVFDSNKKIIAIVLGGIFVISVVVSLSLRQNIVKNTTTKITPTKSATKRNFANIFDMNPKPIEINNYSIKIRSEANFVFNSVGIPKFKVGETIPVVIYGNSNDEEVTAWSVAMIYDSTRMKYFTSAKKSDSSVWDISISQEDGKVIVYGKKKEMPKTVKIKEEPLVDLRFEATSAGPVSFFFDNDEKISYIYNSTGKNILKDAVGISLIIR